ncbi:hypothetical protein KCU64_g20, partial [Aureobasidium melanogenum]
LSDPSPQESAFVLVKTDGAQLMPGEPGPSRKKMLGSRYQGSTEEPKPSLITPQPSSTCCTTDDKSSKDELMTDLELKAPRTISTVVVRTISSVVEQSSELE